MRNISAQKKLFPPFRTIFLWPSAVVTGIARAVFNANFAVD
jgi:hypothetical protein